MHLSIKFILYFTIYVHQIEKITALGRGGKFEKQTQERYEIRSMTAATQKNARILEC